MAEETMACRAEARGRSGADTPGACLLRCSPTCRSVGLLGRSRRGESAGSHLWPCTVEGAEGGREREREGDRRNVESHSSSRGRLAAAHNSQRDAAKVDRTASGSTGSRREQGFGTVQVNYTKYGRNSSLSFISKGGLGGEPQRSKSEMAISRLKMEASPTHTRLER